MTDIGEQLHKEAEIFNNTPVGDVLKRALSEIGRLSGDRTEYLELIAKNNHEMARLHVEIKRLESENARLTEQCGGLLQAALNNGEEILRKEAEIEQLKTAIKDCSDGGPCAKTVLS